MSRFMTYLLGLAALALLAYFCVRRYAPEIQAELYAQSVTLLNQKGHRWASVSGDGRDITLAGEAPDPQTLTEATLLLEGVEGVRIVHNRATVTSKSPETVQTAPQAVAQSLPDPYRFSADYDGRRVVLGGHVPDEKTKVTLITDANRLFGAERVDEQLVVTGAAPDYWRIEPLRAILLSLPEHEKAAVSLAGQRLVLNGEVASPEAGGHIRDQLQKALPDGYVSEFNTTVIQAETLVAAGDDVELERCQQRLDQLLSDNQIRFKVASAELDPVSTELLGSLAATAVSCPGARIEIAGHTDSSGDDVMNLGLSQQRAEAVMQFLVLHRVEPERLLGKGYGEDRPIADNSTPEGRALNRRIEMNILEE